METGCPATSHPLWTSTFEGSRDLKDGGLFHNQLRFLEAASLEQAGAIPEALERFTALCESFNLSELYHRAQFRTIATLSLKISCLYALLGNQEQREYWDHKALQWVSSSLPIKLAGHVYREMRTRYINTLGDDFKKAYSNW